MKKERPQKTCRATTLLLEPELGNLHVPCSLCVLTTGFVLYFRRWLRAAGVLEGVVVSDWTRSGRYKSEIHPSERTLRHAQGRLLPTKQQVGNSYFKQICTFSFWLLYPVWVFLKWLVSSLNSPNSVNRHALNKFALSLSDYSALLEFFWNDWSHCRIHWIQQIEFIWWNWWCRI